MAANTWTAEKVKLLLDAQADPRAHGYTCANQGDAAHLHQQHVLLVPTVRGWICPYCDYTQTHT